MNEKNEHINFEQLAGRYLSEETTEQEILELENQVKENPELKKQFTALRKIWRQSQAQKVSFSSKESWQNIADQITENKVVEMAPPKSKRFFALRIAASIVVLVALGFTLFYLLGNPQVELMADNSILEQKLPDGSKITLNQNSTLVFAKVFKGDERRVKLSGDAYFDVARNEDKPFIIETEDVSIKVLGTSFYVNAKPGLNSIEVVVNSGKVAMIDQNENSIELDKGEVGVFEKSEKLLTESVNDDRNYLSWKTKRMLFVDMPMTEVARIIEKTYNIKVDLSNPSIGSCRLTATFEDNSLEDVALIISETFGFESSITSEKLTFTGNGCN